MLLQEIPCYNAVLCLNDVVTFLFNKVLDLVTKELGVFGKEDG